MTSSSLTPSRPLVRPLGVVVLAAALVAGATACSSDGDVARGVAHGATHADARLAEGFVPEGTTVFDDDLPAVSGLDPDLQAALRAASTAAASEGITLRINSGWRSAQMQEGPLRDAVDRYGSEQEAARWVATAETSPHVSGDAVDIGPWGAAEWLSENGAGVGLCQIYINEAWHFELRPTAVDEGCPRMYLDPTQDPRMG